MRPLQVAFNRSKLAEFVVVDPDVLERLQDVHARIPQAGPAPSGPHALVASLLGHCVSLAAEGSPIPAEFRRELDLVGKPDLTTSDAANPLFALLPRPVFALRTEAALNVIAPWFMRSLEVPGDVCEIGCFRGTMSVKFAYALKTLGIDKTVYAFDTFEGFTTDDPDGGQVGKGYYSDSGDGFEELTRWSKVIPVRPIKGDATETCRILKAPLSFVWLDLDHGVLMRPVFETLWPLLSDRTILGVDDVGRIDGAGRPVTPGVEPWVDELVAAGRVTELARYPGHFTRFYRVNR